MSPPSPPSVHLEHVQAFSRPGLTPHGVSPAGRDSAPHRPLGHSPVLLTQEGGGGSPRGLPSAHRLPEAGAAASGQLSNV